MTKQRKGWSLRKLLCATLIIGPLATLPTPTWAKDNIAKNVAADPAIIATSHTNVANAIQTTNELTYATPATVNFGNTNGTTASGAASDLTVFTGTALKEGGVAVSAAEIVGNVVNFSVTDHTRAPTTTDPGTNVAIVNNGTIIISAISRTTGSFKNNGPDAGTNDTLVENTANRFNSGFRVKAFESV